MILEIILFAVCAIGAVVSLLILSRWEKIIDLVRSLENIRSRGCPDKRG